MKEEDFNLLHESLQQAIAYKNGDVSAARQEILSDEIPAKHHKKGGKTVKKSKHRHVYEDVLVKRLWTFQGKPMESYSLNGRCKYCGKIGGTNFDSLTTKTPEGWSRMLTNEEILNKYGHLDVITTTKWL